MIEAAFGHLTVLRREVVARLNPLLTRELGLRVQIVSDEARERLATYCSGMGASNGRRSRVAADDGLKGSTAGSPVIEGASPTRRPRTSVDAAA